MANRAAAHVGDGEIYKKRQFTKYSQRVVTVLFDELHITCLVGLLRYCDRSAMSGEDGQGMFPSLKSDMDSFEMSELSQQ